MTTTRPIPVKKNFSTVLICLLFVCFLLLPGGVNAIAGQVGSDFLDDLQGVFVDIAEKVKPAVVNISPVTEPHPSSKNPEGKPPDAPSGSGSGVIVDKKGYIITNNHVVGDAEEVEVRLSDKSKFTGKVVGKDPDTDLALVKVESKHDLPFVPMGDSSKVKVGQWAIAVGNPFGLDRTVTVGVVSALGREGVNLTKYEDFIQTDASINPGNSGGPLLNIRGEVIGINTAIISFAQGIGFAIPSNMTQDVITQLKSSGKVVRGWLGIGIQPLTEELSTKFGAKESEGVLVNEVFDGDPAAKAGVQPGDIITKVAGQEVTTPGTLARVIAGVTPGKKIDIDVIRENKHKVLTAVLSVRREEATPASIPTPKEGKLGLNLQELSKELAEKFNVKEGSGLLITKVDPDSPAAIGGLKEGDLISEINREKVATLQDFSSILDKSKKDSDLLFRIIRENRGLFLVVKPKEK